MRVIVPPQVRGWMRVVKSCEFSHRGAGCGLGRSPSGPPRTGHPALGPARAGFVGLLWRLPVRVAATSRHARPIPLSRRREPQLSTLPETVDLDGVTYIGSASAGLVVLARKSPRREIRSVRFG
jgi:hypothetical protein